MSELAETAVQPQPDTVAASPTVLEVRDLVTGYGDVPFLRISQLVLRRSEAVALLGANGSGKTTLLRTLVGLQPAWDGQVIVLGDDITDLPTHRRAARGLIMVPPGKALFAGLDVEDNLLMGAYLEESKTVVNERMKRVYDLFPELYDLRESLAGVLSGGEQQMCSIGRALMSEPEILLIDEISQGLAPVIVDRMMERLKHIREETQLPILFVEQDVVAASILADRGYVLRQGSIEIEGSMDAVISDVKTQRAYLGL